MSTVLAIIVLSVAAILQTTIASRVTLLNGPADLIMLTILSWVLQDRSQTIWIWPLLGGLFYGIFSALPIWLPMIAYLLVTTLTLALRRRVWQVPILALFVSVFVGTLVTNALTYVVLSVRGVPLDIIEAINLILIPSLILNLILAIPVSAIVGEISRWASPAEVEA
jgi:hypothetical protein